MAFKVFRRWALKRFDRCQWCRVKLTLETSTADHILPRAKNGTDEKSNLCLSCLRCNHGRADRGNGDRPPHGPGNWQEVWDEEYGTTPEQKPVATSRRSWHPFRKPRGLHRLWVRLDSEPWRIAKVGSRQECESARASVNKKLGRRRRVEAVILPAE